MTLPANKVGLIVFDGVAGQRVSLGINGVTISGSYGLATVSIYKPNGRLLQSPFEFGSAGMGHPVTYCQLQAHIRYSSILTTRKQEVSRFTCQRIWRQRSASMARP